MSAIQTTETNIGPNLDPKVAFSEKEHAAIESEVENINNADVGLDYAGEIDAHVSPEVSRIYDEWVLLRHKIESGRFGFVVPVQYSLEHDALVKYSAHVQKYSKESAREGTMTNTDARMLNLIIGQVKIFSHFSTQLAQGAVYDKLSSKRPYYNEKEDKIVAP
jgi:hypothetical protein